VISQSINGLWNTQAGRNGTLSSAGVNTGNFYPTERVEHAFDRNMSTSYTSYGWCNMSMNALTCGENTGAYVTLQQGATIFRAFRFLTAAANAQIRDPMTLTIEGSNQSGSSLMLGSAWNLIYNGSSGLENTLNRSTYGTLQELSQNTVPYSSYRILITSKRSNGTSTQYAEFELLG
jgi:hypothetical protein